MDSKIIQQDVIKSSLYGEIPISNEQIYEFEHGLIGFSSIHNFVLFPYENSDLFILHALSEDTSFILIPALKIERELAFQVDSDTVEMLGVNDANEVVPFVIVHIVDDKPYMNTKAPILLVPSKQKGCQYVINDPSYSIREPLVMKESERC
ncbi:flagellar assembly protein FliW [Paenibacillus sp. IITD108]|uniref:flagellar assembly protein FliW n=1 Tax=Paenibacillus sp. IITD108 TaxID=3116649 RepID=UPI002F41D97F